MSTDRPINPPTDDEPNDDKPPMDLHGYVVVLTRASYVAVLATLLGSAVIAWLGRNDPWILFAGLMFAMLLLAATLLLAIILRILLIARGEEPTAMDVGILGVLILFVLFAVGVFFWLLFATITLV